MVFKADARSILNQPQKRNSACRLMQDLVYRMTRIVPCTTARFPISLNNVGETLHGVKQILHAHRNTRGVEVFLSQS
jgi:hypothetical protein